MEQLFKIKEIISNIFSSNIEEIKKVSLICNTISEKLLIAAEIETLKEYQEDLNINSIIELFLANKAATFCGGAALTLYKELQELNFMPIIFHYGNYNNGLTHVVVLIKLKNEFYLFDPYFNIYYEDNFNYDKHFHTDVSNSYPQYKQESLFDIKEYCMNILGYRQCITRFNGGNDNLLIP